MRSGDDAMRYVALDWHRSSFCQAGECVEITEADGIVIMRSSAHPDSGQIYLSRKEFGSFLAAAKAGAYAPL